MEEELIKKVNNLLPKVRNCRILLGHTKQSVLYWLENAENFIQKYEGTEHFDYTIDMINRYCKEGEMLLRLDEKYK